ncbi:MAG: NAD(P)/FAD-dependent oxidoreductase, partial [Phenylobacterium sp.]|nr:NAD(P)/FAD-dependent oxidoreductase [Phenylobacterium sp.]
MAHSVRSAQKTVAVVGGGPAGLFAAERLAVAGCAVTVWERMPSVGRKFLMAGRGGLNLTHSEGFEAFAGRYGAAADWARPMLAAFPPGELAAWAEGLGQPTFVGSSGRVFPKAMKASPLLRAWLARLAGLGVAVRTRSAWLGWADDGALRFATPDGEAV